MIRKKKAQIHKRKREACNRIQFTFPVVSTYLHLHITHNSSRHYYLREYASDRTLVRPATQAYVEFPWFKTPRDRLLWKSFRILPQSLRPHSRQYLTLGHGIFLLHPFNLLLAYHEPTVRSKVHANESEAK